MYTDRDLENLLPYYGITLMVYGIQLFIISFIFDQMDNRILYRMLVIGRVKYYVKSINCYVTLSSISKKRITREQAKVEIAREF